MKENAVERLLDLLCVFGAVWPMYSATSNRGLPRRMALLEQTEIAINFTDEPATVVLPVPGIAGEDQM